MYNRIILKLSGETLAPEKTPEDKNASVTFDAARVNAAAEMIIRLADLGIQGDLNVIVPKLTEAIKAYRAKQNV